MAAVQEQFREYHDRSPPGSSMGKGPFGKNGTRSGPDWSEIS